MVILFTIRSIFFSRIAATHNFFRLNSFSLNILPFCSALSLLEKHVHFSTCYLLASFYVNHVVSSKCCIVDNTISPLATT
uniref:Putative secreted protein n=1 Tax=Anopheles triannulatus TaxID=58253 RepID=A0A2M4B362_9DIPT